MKISVNKAQTGIYSVSLDGATHTLSTRDLKTLLLEAVKVMTPGALPTLSPREEAHELGDRLKTANDPGLQKFINSAADDDIVIFLKCTEDDTALHEKMFANMSERKHKMLSEDLEYRFHDDILDDDLSTAVVKLVELTNHLQDEGTLEFSQS